MVYRPYFARWRRLDFNLCTINFDLFSLFFFFLLCSHVLHLLQFIILKGFRKRKYAHHLPLNEKSKYAAKLSSYLLLQTHLLQVTNNIKTDMLMITKVIHPRTLDSLLFVKSPRIFLSLAIAMMVKSIGTATMPLITAV